MATLADILELRGPLERGLAAGLYAAARLAPFTRKNAVVFQKDTPRFEIIVAIGSATGARRAFPVEGLTRFTRHNFTVSFKAVSRPASALTRNEGESDADFQTRVDANSNLHAELVAVIRSYASSAAQLSGSDTKQFPNHYIAEALRALGSASSLKPEANVEETTLTFAGQVGIRESAWPVAPVEPDITPVVTNPLVTVDGDNVGTLDGDRLVVF